MTWGALVLSVGMLLAPHPVVAAEARTIVRIGSDVVIDEGTRIRDAVAVGGSVTVNGAADGDVVAVGGSVVLGPGATVGGDVVAVGGEIRRADGARIGGDLVEVNVPGVSSVVGAVSGGTWHGWSWALGTTSFVGLLALALLIVAVVPGPVGLVADTVRTHPWTVLVWGVLGLVLTVPLAVVLAVSVVGIVLIPVEAVLVGCAFLVGYVAVAQLIGMKMAEAVRRPGLGPLWGTLWGLVTLWVVGWVPLLGWLVKTVVSLLGFGAVLETVFSWTKPYRQIKAG